jgi:Mrp family chromosome partitioning ATPase
LVVEATKPEHGPIVAANLAVELAHAGNSVTLVELTPGWLRYAELFNLGARNDRAIVLGQPSSPADGFLEVLPATPSTGDVYEETELARIVASASGQLVIASGPPLLDDADPEAFVDGFDATILVVPLQTTSRGALAKLRGLIGQFAKPPVGFVAVGDQTAGAVAAQGLGRPSSAGHDLEPAALPRPVVAPVATSGDATLDADWGRGH